jgi:hypothetical protein
MKIFFQINGDATAGSYQPVSTTTTAINDSEGNDLEASLLVETPSHIPAVSSQLLLEIVAPADLPEGYPLDAVFVDDNHHKTIIPVTVPPGGIEKGQTLSLPYSAVAAAKNNNNTAATTSTNPLVREQSMNIPVGHWRDGLWDCFRYGLCHAHLWTACACSARK